MHTRFIIVQRTYTYTPPPPPSNKAKNKQKEHGSIIRIIGLTVPFILSTFHKATDYTTSQVLYFIPKQNRECSVSVLPKNKKEHSPLNRSELVSTRTIQSNLPDSSTCQNIKIILRRKCKLMQ